MLDLPEPFRPVMALNWGSNPATTWRCAYDLKPSMVISLMNMVAAAAPAAAQRRLASGQQRPRLLRAVGACEPRRRACGQSEH